MSIACYITLHAAHSVALCLQGCVGLCNLGNTCFANSILQVRSCPQAQLPSNEPSSEFQLSTLSCLEAATKPPMSGCA